VAEWSRRSDCPEAGAVQVRGSLQRAQDGLTIVEPKTLSSRRRVALTRAAVEALRLHRVGQAEERLRLGGAWEDNDLAFANEVGRPAEVRNLVRRSFLPLLKRAGPPRIRFHDLRHSTAGRALPPISPSLPAWVSPHPESQSGPHVRICRLLPQPNPRIRGARRHEDFTPSPCEGEGLKAEGCLAWRGV